MGFDEHPFREFADERGVALRVERLMPAAFVVVEGYHQRLRIDNVAPVRATVPASLTAMVAMLG
jgi:hypothetical protein